jgi:DNA-binding XRE family transcriptional regulator
MSQAADRFDAYLKKRLKNPRFRKYFQQARLAVELAHRIVQLRKRLGITQAELACRMGTKQQTISRLESGEYEGFTLRTLQRIAEATQTDLVIAFRTSPRKSAM